MIDNRNKYIAATPPNDILIDGGIMPKRDHNDDGSWKILRGEDPSFLYEAGRRINSYANYSSYPSAFNISKSLSKSDLQDAIANIHRGAFAGGTWPVRPELKSPTVSAQGGNVKLYQNIAATAWPSSGSPSREAIDEVLTTGTRSQTTGWRYSSWYDYGNNLSANRIRDMFYDLNRVKGVLHPSAIMAYYPDRLSERDNPVSIEYNYDDPDHPSTPTSVKSVTETKGNWETYSYNYGICSWARDDNFFGNRESDTNFSIIGLTGGTLPLSANKRVSPWCAMIVPVSTKYETYDYVWGGGSTSNWTRTTTSSVSYQDMLVVEGSVDSETGQVVFNVDANTIITCVAQGRSLPTSYEAMPYGLVGNNTIKESSLFIRFAFGTTAANSCILFYDEGIDFSSIGWVWPPAP